MRISRAASAKSTIALWRWLWAQPGTPEVQLGSYPEIIESLSGTGNIPNTSALAHRLDFMESLGLLVHKRRSLGFQKGVANIFTLQGNVEDGAKRIGQHIAAGGTIKSGRKSLKATATPTAPNPEVVAIRTDEQDRPVEAVVGPDAPSPFEGLRALKRDEPAALVEAARQYEHRQDFVLERLVEIEKLGVTIDREKVMKAIKLDRDDELEGIVKVLPYVGELEARVNQSENWRKDVLALRGEQREWAKERSRLEGELQRQKDANTRLAEKMVQQTTRQPQVLVGEH